MNGNPVVWFEIYVQDMGRARQFYESVFQIGLRRLDAPLADIEIWAFPSETGGYGSSGALVKTGKVSPGGAGALIYFRCDDCAVEEARAGKFGGKIERPKMSIGEYGFVSLVIDTEGNRIGLHSM